jgi:hypothetical protein
MYPNVQYYDSHKPRKQENKFFEFIKQEKESIERQLKLYLNPGENHFYHRFILQNQLNILNNLEFEILKKKNIVLFFEYSREDIKNNIKQFYKNKASPLKIDYDLVSNVYESNESHNLYALKGQLVLLDKLEKIFYS